MSAVVADSDASPFFRGASPLPLLYGHRGTRVHAPENTLGAFLWAQQVGADGVELDTRLCGSGELVVFHDPELSRLADLPWEVAQTPYSELAAVELGGGYGIPLLSDVLDELGAHGMLVNVEVKADGQDVDALCAAVAALLGDRPAPQRTRLCVSSFSRRVLAHLAAACPQLTRAALSQTAEQLQGPQAAAAQGVHPNHALLSPRLLQGLHAAGKFVNAWTVNDLGTARRLAADGIDGLITDDVASLRRGM